MAVSARSSTRHSLFLFGLFVWSVASYRSGIRPWLCQQDPQQDTLFSVWSFCMVRCFIQIGYTPMAVSARSWTSLFFSLCSFLYGPLLHLNWVLNICPWLCQQDPEHPLDCLCFCVVCCFIPSGICAMVCVAYVQWCVCVCVYVCVCTVLLCILLLYLSSF